MGCRFDVSQPIRRAYGPVCEEDVCSMVMDAGLDSAGHDTGEPDSAGPNPSSPNPAGPNPSGHTSAPPDGAGESDPRHHAEPDMPDPNKLAQDWITLWQSELSAMAADPEIRESWQTVMALWAGTMSAMLRGLPSARDAGYDGPHRRSGPADAPRAAPAAAAPDPRDAEIDRLARHVAALEQRLADLTRRVERGAPVGVQPAGHSPGRAKRDPKPGPGRKPRR
jgi:hypothetical protein